LSAADATLSSLAAGGGLIAGPQLCPPLTLRLSCSPTPSSSFFFLRRRAPTPPPPSAQAFRASPCVAPWTSPVPSRAPPDSRSFLNSVSARRRVSSAFTLTIGTPCKALEDRADQKDVVASNFSLAAKLGHASSE